MSARRRGQDELMLSLFPFLGVFVSIVGVFAFLDICLYMINRPVVVQSALAQGEGRHRQPYIVECRGGRVSLAPPALELINLGKQRPAEVEAAIARMGNISGQHEIMLGELRSTENALRQFFDDIDTINAYAARQRLPHEGYVVIGVSADGVACYWTVDKTLRASHHPGIGVASLALMPGMQLRQAELQ